MFGFDGGFHGGFDPGLDPEADAPDDETGAAANAREVPAAPSEATKRMMRSTTQEAEDAGQMRHRQDKQRQAQVAERGRVLKQFLRKNGFASVNEPKRVLLLWESYPLHVAVEKNNLRVVEMLLAEGADVSQKNSSGHTAAQVAQKRNKKGERSTMLQVLQRTGDDAGGFVAVGGA